MATLQPVGTVVSLLAGSASPTTTPTPLDSTAVSSPESAAVAATVFAVVGSLVVLARLRR